MSTSNPDPPGEPPRKKRAVDLLTSEQLKRKRDGDKAAQRHRRERLKVQIETLEDQVAQLHAQNRLLEERLSAATSANTPATTVTYSAEDNVTDGPATASLGLNTLDSWPDDRPSTSPLSSGEAADVGFWPDMTTLGSIGTSTTGVGHSVTSEQNQMKPSIFQMLNDNPVGFGEYL